MPDATDRRPFAVLVLMLALSLGGCKDEEPLGPRIRDGEGITVAVVIPAGSATGLRHAAQDLGRAFETITGATEAAEILEGDPEQAQADHVVAVRIDPDWDAGSQCYRIRRGQVPDTGGTKQGLEIVAGSETGGMYGLYRVALDLGVRYIHPEQTFFPGDAGARLPWRYSDTLDCPGFPLRGFHEHTQHPIVMSDFLLRTEDPTFRNYVTRYLRWLARNRQNALSYMLLKTVDLDRWLPYITSINREGHDYGIKMGVSVSFVDQQQNAFKLVNEDDTSRTDFEQIQEGLDPLVQAGFDFILLQIGSSEFTKPGDATTIQRLDTAVEILDREGVDSWAWIHTTCSLEDDQGGYFFHLPLQADWRLGAFVHTTMFYTLVHPAPVYDCEDFGQQVEFMTQADGQRSMTYFPETAWWLGFDNNLPLVLPITGWSRAWDIQEVLPDYDVRGHVTFTSGREWTYWQYDHYLTRVTWDTDLTWDAYLDWLRPLYGRQGNRVAQVLKEWTRLQVQHLYEDNPLIYFYLAGELPQDEIGAAAGILARRPKLAFQDLVRYDDEAYDAWYQQDYLLLQEMLEGYQRLLDRLPRELESGSVQKTDLYRELYDGLWVFVRRIEHALALYGAVASIRTWDQEVRRARMQNPPEEPDPGLKGDTLAEAGLALTEARAISDEVITVLQAMEDLYRYPVELLARAKPETPTSYPFGYLEQTSTGFFWTRREDQLQNLIARTWLTEDDDWQTVPDELFYTYSDLVEMTQPDSELAANALTGFIPQLLFGLKDFDATGGSVTLIMAQDYNENFLPDPGSEQPLVLQPTTGDWWEGTTAVYTLQVHDSSGEPMGDLALLDPLFRLEIRATGDQVDDLAQGEIIGAIASQALVDIIVSIGGIDAPGAGALIKAVYDIPPEVELPPTLPFSFRMTYERATS